MILLTSANVPESWFTPDPPANGRRRTTFRARGYYYGQGWRTQHWATLASGHRICVRCTFGTGHVTGRMVRR
jgi:hypothetical protein